MYLSINLVAFVYCIHFDIHYYLNVLVLILQLLNEIHSRKIDFILLCMLWLNFVMDIKWSSNRMEQSKMGRRRGGRITTKPFWLTCGGSLLFVKCVFSQAEVWKLLRYCHHVIETWQPKFFAVISWWKSVIAQRYKFLCLRNCVTSVLSRMDFFPSMTIHRIRFYPRPVVATKSKYFP